jgi:hypothetical protein
MNKLQKIGKDFLIIMCFPSIFFWSIVIICMLINNYKKKFIDVHISDIAVEIKTIRNYVAGTAVLMWFFVFFFKFI